MTRFGDRSRRATGDTTTPYWFPSETRGGMMNEARLVLPIPPGTHWMDAKPTILPSTRRDGTVEPKKLPGEKKARVNVARASRPCLEDAKKDMGGTPMPR